MDMICPICQTKQKSRGLLFHVRNNHAKEFADIGWRKIKTDAKKVPKEMPVKQEATSGLASKQENRDIGAWYDETGQRMYFSPTPVSSAVINQFSKSTDPSAVVNKALPEFATARGIQPAIIKTEGGKAMSMLGGNSEDHELNKTLKLLAASNQMQQSYNQYSPGFQMIDMMKHKVNNGMSMGQFGKDMMQMIFMLKMMEGV